MYLNNFEGAKLHKKNGIEGFLVESLLVIGYWIEGIEGIEGIELRVDG
jgi:hypothetical protein